MARYKPYDVNQVTLIPVSFPDQILPGSFEYALNEIVDEHIDLRAFEARYQNAATGCLAYDPAILLKIVLFGYYKGLISSRRLAEACQRNVQFKALTADTEPHFTTIGLGRHQLGHEFGVLERHRDSPLRRPSSAQEIMVLDSGGVRHTVVEIVKADHVDDV